VNKNAKQVHDEACAAGEKSYIDPITGYVVFTRLGLLARSKCCGCACRHCPFQHEKVPILQRAKKIQQAAYLTNENLVDNKKSSDVVFWSGGKDSFLALRAMQKALREKPRVGEEGEDRTQIILLTTFDATNRQVAHQEISIADIVQHVSALGLPLVGVPLHSGLSYVDQIELGLKIIPAIERIAFGDLHLEHIKEWRTRNLSPIAESLGAKLYYPLWNVSYEDLLDDLALSAVPCIICAAPDEALTGKILGHKFNRNFIKTLPESVDKFGENGEFHTVMKTWE
jgi:diphthamide synthase (EF-2-diphthine--ammonia ligase)